MAASGTADVNVGAFPGVDVFTTTITAAGCTPSSRVEAWLFPANTANHSIDEHLIDGPRVYAHSPAAGSFSVSLVGKTGDASKSGEQNGGLIYGIWHIGWVHD